MTPPTPKLLDQVRGRLRLRHYSLRTEQAYVSWIRRFILASGQRHPGQMGQVEGEAFLTKLAARGQVSSGTQEVARLLSMLEGNCRLVAGLLYGSGMRLLECLRLRSKAMDIVRGEIAVRDGWDASICGMWSAGRAQPS
ncbi:phage integrase N-terminal SAM-like domain-containing protein [Xanthomonas citri pv. malvacearum]|nr:phage integrase N-terminal SAM-like domain-containing protein [Xanthomonas citri]WAW86787.1 phage integrase N-terminal SAM-like domain-containing protein [Xanthomonas citri pv. malvacearum]